MNNSTLEEFKRLFREADFQHFIKIGAPSDEYDHEALYLYEHISPSNSVEEIQEIIWNHFYYSFCTGSIYDKNGSERKWKNSKKKAINSIGTVDTYKTIAEEIKKIIG